MSKAIVVDANIAVKWPIPEALHVEAKALLNQWLETATVLYAPASFIIEVDSVLRKKVVARKEITLGAARQAWEDIQEIPISYLNLFPLRQRAWEISIELDFPSVYDTVYLAAAEQKNCDFWTADEKFHNSVRERFPFVKWLGSFTP
jgi:predicted nucleic acid-binding protein